jgi:hypothetical protein
LGKSSPRKNKNNKGVITMLNAGLFGTGMKAARTGDQIDAQVVAARGLVTQASMAASQFDSIEMQMQQIASMLQQSQDPSLMMLSGQFSMLQTMVDNTQKQIQSSLTQLAPILQEIDNLTNKIQN